MKDNKLHARKIIRKTLSGHNDCLVPSANARSQQNGRLRVAFCSCKRWKGCICRTYDVKYLLMICLNLFWIGDVPGRAYVLEAETRNCFQVSTFTNGVNLTTCCCFSPQESKVTLSQQTICEEMQQVLVAAAICLLRVLNVSKLTSDQFPWSVAMVTHLVSSLTSLLLQKK